MFFMVKFWQVSNINLKSSYRRCSIKKAVLKNVAIFIGKHLPWVAFWWIFRLSSRQLYYKEIRTQVLSCEYCKTFKNIYFKGHLWTTASELYWFKVEVVIEKTDVFRDVFRDDNRRRIQNPLKYLKWSFFQK